MKYIVYAATLLVVWVAVAFGQSEMVMPGSRGISPQSFSKLHGAVLSYPPRDYTGTADTLQPSDCQISGVQSNSGSSVTETVPNYLPAGCNIAVEQVGAGTVTFVAGAGATMHSACSTKATNAQYAIIWVHVEKNTNGVSAVFDVAGGCT